MLCTKSGIIKMAPEDQPNLIYGYLQVVDMVVNEGRNVTLIVSLAKVGGNISQIPYGKRVVVEFNGVFFGVYDPFYNP